ncbi:MAG: hypothetical protein U0572_02135 [Phycisphaerales bacterium]
MAASDRSRNNFRAGLFVVASMALALAVFFTLQKLSFTKQNVYQLRFTVDGGVAGLGPGSEVRIGGLKRGEVVTIRPQTLDGVLTRLDVDIAIDASITLYRNAKALRVASILGNTSWINFVSVGGPTGPNRDGVVEQAEVLPPGEWIDVVEAPGLLTTVVGGHSAEQIVHIIDQAAIFSDVLAEVPADYHTRIVPALDAASQTIVRLHDDYEEWRVKVGQTLDSASAAAKNLENGTYAANELIAEARATLADARPKIANTLTNLESASATAKDVVEDVRTTTLPKLSSVLGQGERSLGELSDLLDRLDAEIAARIPDIRSFLGDVRVAADQLKLATIEVRRSPWRLLYKPSTDVIAHEQLYEATRSFAEATNDLRAAAESVREIAKLRTSILDENPELRAELQKSLLDALSRYEEAQRRLYGVLTQEPAGGK